MTDLTKDGARKPSVLVVDDQMSMAEMLADGLGERGYDVLPMCSSREAAKLLERGHDFDALVTDLRMPEIDGLGLLAISRRVTPARAVIVMTAYSALDTAIESIRQGAYHYVTKPFKLEELVLFLGRALEEARLRTETLSLKRALKERRFAADLLGASSAMKAIAGLVARVADANVPVLIRGETGTGKGLVARAIHEQGERASSLFVHVNCASLPENLLESELFGHVKGAFTGATATRPGLFEEANGGTLFLDEIGEMTPAVQAKLLHVLEQGVVRAVGSNKERPVDTRIIAATHRDLRERIAEGLFREDLLYRLDVVSLEIPPLRRRREDIPSLVEHFLRQSKGKHPRSPVDSISAEVLARLLEHAWPGNVRELEHLIERLVLLGHSTEVAVSDLPPGCLLPAQGGMPLFRGAVRPMREMQALYAAWVYEQVGCSRKLAAEKLGVDPKTLTGLLADGDLRTL
jgi:two-component system response regulator HydG